MMITVIRMGNPLPNNLFKYALRVFLQRKISKDVGEQGADNQEFNTGILKPVGEHDGGIL